MLRIDSHNSGEPSSFDGPGKKTRLLREAFGKKTGGKLGHKGNTLKQVAHPTQVVTHSQPEHCERCGCTLAQQEVRVAQQRQVSVFPLQQTAVTPPSTAKGANHQARTAATARDRSAKGAAIRCPAVVGSPHACRLRFR